MENQDPKERIIQATLEIIGNHGTDKVTIREIASRVGVNVAAVNYYFGSKSNLIQQSMEYFADTMQDAFFNFHQKEIPLKDKLYLFLTSFAETAVTYPGVVKSLVNQMMENGEIRSEVALTMEKGSVAIKQVIGQLIQSTDDKKLSFIALQLMSSIIYPILMSTQLPMLYGFDYRDKEAREEYIRSSMEFIFNNY
ncbi:TetR/AcrR family transcriptional regulator [Bacillus arachidis]|uniref:TetR/AcrR family transcriptional regulator n=1 Tax=Bacillus arachidis TaxID=2819290 RepID=A0ABS3P5T8_9BACI|nr:TetR/AcrR family transcriptional regulator [Bacillus arachidis]MBO1628554.1 TetR/AcrR family transcriptional regulator [Bacillus arachidis]